MENEAKKVGMFGQAGLPIEEGAYLGRKDIEAAEINEGVTGIGARAFAGCTSLKSVMRTGG